VLTVIPNESYEAFAKSLQQEIEDETGAQFTGRVKNARAKVKVKPKQLEGEEAVLFEAIWQKINYQTRYSVRLDTPELIEKCTAALADNNQYPKVTAPKIRSAKARIVMTTEGVHGVQSGAAQTDVRDYNVSVPDVYAYIQNRVHLSRATLFAILDGSGRLDELLINPQAFLDTAIAAIKNSLQALLVAGIEYHEINGQRYEMTLWEEVETYQSSIFPPVADQMTPPVSKTILQAQPLDDQKAEMGEAFSCVLIDSAPESKFAQDCSNDGRVRFFFKLPSRFKIPTPLGTYNPDWAVVFEGDARVYFVAETKSSTVEQDRRQAENLKIACGRKHFALSEDVVFKDVTELEGLVA
jgi:type III restriction enzyme